MEDVDALYEELKRGGAKLLNAPKDYDCRGADMGFLTRFLGKRLYRERREAERLGIRALELEREIPLFSRDGERMIFAPYPCVRYSLVRRERKGPAWRLVQRTKPLGANMPNDFLLSASVPLKAGLQEYLLKAAEACSDGMFEFEGTPTEVALYWTEWGGPEKVRRLHYYLERLAAY